ncbi:MAG: DNA methylase [Butyricicoccus sp.]|nr:DNA methylase [Butyricicoccus sp.]MBQ8585563.1 DNA methylase [Butyricicoccus sp.]
MQKNKTYIAIDLKSFYASVECIERGLDPLTTNLVVADAARSQKTICLAVTPALKAYGIPGRARLFEVVQKVKEINFARQQHAPGRRFAGVSCNAAELQADPALALDYIAAPPRMAHYIDYSTRIYNIYLKYVAPEDIHVYSIDEVFLDATAYLPLYKLSARDFTKKILQNVLTETGITATAGIGTNLYLCKAAMDIVAKHVPPDADGVRIAELDEYSYRRLLWDHRPLTDFWRVGRGYARKLEAHGLMTMGDIARCSIDREELLYKLFGVNAELLIDHAWGWESCTMQDIKSYRPSTNSISSGQVLHCPYPWDKARLIVQEMTDQLALDLVEKDLVTDQIVLTIGYDIENLSDPARARAYHGPVTTDYYGRKVPKHAHGTVNLDQHTASSKQITDSVQRLYDRIADPALLIRRISLGANHVLPRQTAQQNTPPEQLDLFCDYEMLCKTREQEEKKLAQEQRRQQAILSIKKKYGKNAILKGMNLTEGATTMDRNRQIGGHKA